MQESRNFNTGQYFFSKISQCATTLSVAGLKSSLKLVCGKCHIISRHLTVFQVLPSHVGVYVQVLLLTFSCALILPRGTLHTLRRHYPSMRTQASPRGTGLGVASRRKTSHLYRFKGSIKLKVMEEELLVRARVTVQPRQTISLKGFRGPIFWCHFCCDAQLPQIMRESGIDGRTEAKTLFANSADRMLCGIIYPPPTQPR